MPPSEKVVAGYFNSLSNWGRWGDSDRLGTLNYLTDERRVAALSCVRTGLSLSCGLCLDPAQQSGWRYGPPQRVPFIAQSDGRMASIVEHIGLVYHGRGVTHIDALSHVSWNGSFYNGVPANFDPETGATTLSVLEASDGIVTRGVLIDVAHLQRSSADPNYTVTPADLDAALARQRVEVRPGDAVLLRTGSRVGGTLPPSYAGWDATCLPWLHEREVAVIGCDTAQDARPSGIDEFPFPIHAVGLVAMGLWMIDNCNLDRLADACALRDQWDFLCCVAPPTFVGLTGGPVNPIAVL
jgi:kynurenine formamidase